MPFNEDQYLAGRDAFECGASLRSIVECCEASKTLPEEDEAISFAVGFGDALLDRLRGIKR